MVVLSSGVERDSTLDVAGWNRLREGIRVATLLGRPIATTLIVHEDGMPTNRFVVGRAMAAGGLEGRWTITDSVVRSTRDEALQIRRQFPQVKRLLLVTSRPHTRRACGAFERVGFRVTCHSAGHGAWWHILFAYLYEVAGAAKYTAARWM